MVKDERLVLSARLTDLQRVWLGRGPVSNARLIYMLLSSRQKDVVDTYDSVASLLRTR